MFSVIIVFYGRAPASLGIAIPIGFIILSLSRASWWIKHRRDELTDLQAQRYLSRATKVLFASAVLVMATDVMLLRFSDVHMRYFVLMQILASTMAGFYCLMHLSTAASLMALAMMLPFTYFMLSVGQVSAVASTVDTLINVGLMAYVMSGYQRDFANLLRARSETESLSKENLRLANLDMLTNLPNRREFFGAVQHSINSATKTRQSVAVGIIDLDGFKPVNDTHGHQVGDKVLAEIAERLRQAVGDTCFLARVGGDEFAVILDECRDDKTVQVFGDLLVEAVSKPISIGSLVTSVGCSVGFALFPDAAQDADVLFERADYALYHAKRTGKSRCEIFSTEHEQLLKEQGKVEQALRNAVLEEEFYPVFQPIVDAATNRVVAFESLARWESRVLGAVSPMTFIPIAEQAGIITDLTPILLRKSLAAVVHWPDDVHLSFNVSPYDISNESLTLKLIDIIVSSGVDPRRIAIELTESALLHSFSQTNANMLRFQRIGVKVSLDDFGTGYSSLSYIHALPFNKLKIDRSFIIDIESNSKSQDIVRSLVTLCQDLSLACIIEGVETVDQLHMVQNLGGATIQGYYFSRPMPAESVAHYLSDPLPVTAVANAHVLT